MTIVTMIVTLSTTSRWRHSLEILLVEETLVHSVSPNHEDHMVYMMVNVEKNKIKYWKHYSFEILF